MTAGERKPKILVDDDRLNINMLIGLLQDEYEVLAAINGTMGLKAAGRTNPVASISPCLT